MVFQNELVIKVNERTTQKEHCCTPGYHVIVFLCYHYSTTADPHPATDSLMDFVYFHWSNHPFIRGGYTSPTAHVYDLRRVLSSPVEGRLFFAGEATSLRSCSTVPTAIETGVRAAEEVCSVAGLFPCAKL